MLSSMTAFGRGEFRNTKGNYAVEIQSVNRKYLEIFINIPRQFIGFEPELKKLVAEKVGRGKVSVYVEVKLNHEKVKLIRPNVGMARELLKSYDELARRLGYKKKIDLSYVLRNKDVIEHVQDLDEVEEFWGPIAKSTGKALTELCRMKRAEGSVILEDFNLRLAEISGMLTKIKSSSEDGVEKYREKLITRIREFAGGQIDNEEKVLREIAIFAERTDITEEITRLESHIKQFRGYMKSKEPIGRTLDFLVQEMHREINTIGAKAAGLDISRSVVLIKSLLEKIREQVQNIA